MRKWFGGFAQKASKFAGHSKAFALAVLIIIVWVVSGPIFHYSDTWQLVINTGTTIITFLMVFLIQNTQNRDSEALHIKLDEIIYRMEDARDELLDLEELDEDHLNKVRDSYRAEAKKARAKFAERPVEEGADSPAPGTT